MSHDSQRYHRRRRPPFLRAYGAIGPILGAIGTGAETAAGAIGGGLESAAGAVAPGAQSALSSLGSGLQSLFGGGAGAGAGGEAGYLASLGQAVPEGVELAGPSSTFTGPGFLGGLAQGFVHGPQQFANASAGTSLGQGVGGLLSALEQMRGGQANMIRPIVQGISGNVQRPRYDPSGPPPLGQGPIMKMIGQLFAGF